MALFAIQLVRVVLTSLCAVQKDNMPAVLTLNMVYGIQEMLNVIIIRSVHFAFFLITITWIGHRTNNNLCAREIVLR